MNRNPRTVILTFLLIAVVGCASLTSLVDKVKSMTAVEAAVWMTSVYNAEYDSYVTDAAKTDLTDAEREVLRVKKKLLIAAYPLIDAYVESVDRAADIGDVLLRSRAVPAVLALLGM